LVEAVLLGQLPSLFPRGARPGQPSESGEAHPHLVAIVDGHARRHAARTLGKLMSVPLKGNPVSHYRLELHQFELSIGSHHEASIRADNNLESKARLLVVAQVGQLDAEVSKHSHPQQRIAGEAHGLVVRLERVDSKTLELEHDRKVSICTTADLF